MLSKLADQAARSRADDDRGEQWWREEANDETYAPTPAHALAAHMVACLGHTHFAILVMLDEDHPLGPDLLIFDELYESLKILLSRLDALVASHDDIKRVFHRVLTFFAGFPCESGQI